MKHPKLCFRHLKSGNGEAGCAFGTKCKFYHPKICYQFAKRNKCNRADCSFYHSTLRKKNDQAKRGNTDRRLTNSPETGQSTRRIDNSCSMVPHHTAERSARHFNEEEAPTFLEFRRMMQNQMDQMQQIIRMLMERDSAKETPRTRECRCGQHSC